MSLVITLKSLKMFFRTDHPVLDNFKWPYGTSGQINLGILWILLKGLDLKPSIFCIIRDCCVPRLAALVNPLILVFGFLFFKSVGLCLAAFLTFFQI